MFQKNLKILLDEYGINIHNKSTVPLSTAKIKILQPILLSLTIGNIPEKVYETARHVCSEKMEEIVTKEGWFTEEEGDEEYVIAKIEDISKGTAIDTLNVVAPNIIGVFDSEQKNSLETRLGQKNGLEDTVDLIPQSKRCLEIIRKNMVEMF